MASLSIYPQFESNLMSNRNVIDLLLQLKSAKAHGKNYIKVRPPLVRQDDRAFSLLHQELPQIPEKFWLVLCLNFTKVINLV